MSKYRELDEFGLNKQQALFVREYLIDLNASAAAIRAGYSAKSANACSSRLLTQAKVKAAVKAMLEKRTQALEITADRVLRELSCIAFFDVRKLYAEDGSLKNPREWDDDTAAAMAGMDMVEMAGGMKVDGSGPQHVPMFTKKVKAWDKTAALTLAMRHLKLLTDKVEQSGPNGGPIQQEMTVKGTPEEVYRGVMSGGRIPQ